MQIDIEQLAKELAGNMSLEQLRQQQKSRLLTAEAPEFLPAVPITERGRLHIERVKDYTPKAVGPTPRAFKQEMDYEIARRKIWALFELRAAHISHLENRDFNWVFSDEEKAIIKNMILYFICSDKGMFPLSKGLFVYGKPGTGKTEIVQIFERFCKENQLSKAFEFTSMAEIYIRAKSEKGYDPICSNIQLPRVFDEFALHVGAVTTFGDQLDINEAIIEARYKRYKSAGQITHLISNATTVQIEQILSPMLFDRVRSFCTGVQFTGNSKR